MEQLLCHLVGDYWLQNDWMATNKHKVWWIALLHSVVYTIPFLFISQSMSALTIICLSHALVDGTNIVARMNAIKNNEQLDNSVCGYNKERPLWLCWMLCIVQDNTIHLLCNYFAIQIF